MDPGGEMVVLSTNRRNLQQSIGSINNAVCGEMEYFCGDSDVILDQAYTATQLSNCSLDAGSLKNKEHCSKEAR